MHRRTGALLSAIALLAGAACTSSATHSTTPGESSGPSPAIPATGIRGTAKLIGGPWPGRRPLASVKIHVLAHGQVVGLAQTDGRGHFSLALPPGTYHVELGDGQPLSPGKIVVAASGTTRVSLKQYAK